MGYQAIASGNFENANAIGVEVGYVMVLLTQMLWVSDVEFVNAFGVKAMHKARGHFEGVNAMGTEVMFDASGTFDSVNAIGDLVMRDVSGSGTFNSVNAMGNQVMRDASGGTQ